MSSFRPGALTASQADRLSRMEDDVDGLMGMMGESPILVDLTNGVPVIRMSDGGNIPVLISGVTSGQSSSGVLIYNWYEQTFDGSGLRVPRVNGSSGGMVTSGGVASSGNINNPLFEVNNTDLSTILSGGVSIQTWAVRRGMSQGVGQAYEFQYQLISGGSTSGRNTLNVSLIPNSGGVFGFSGIGQLNFKNADGFTLSGTASGTVLVGFSGGSSQQQFLSIEDDVFVVVSGIVLLTVSDADVSNPVSGTGIFTLRDADTGVKGIINLDTGTTQNMGLGSKKFAKDVIVSERELVNSVGNSYASGSYALQVNSHQSGQSSLRVVPQTNFGVDNTVVVMCEEALHLSGGTTLGQITAYGQAIFAQSLGAYTILSGRNVGANSIELITNSVTIPKSGSPGSFVILPAIIGTVSGDFFSSLVFDGSTNRVILNCSTNPGGYSVRNAGSPGGVGIGVTGNFTTSIQVVGGIIVSGV